MAHPHRASSDKAEPLLPKPPPHPCTHRGLGPSWSPGPVQDRAASAHGQGHVSVLQKGMYLPEEGPLLAAPTTGLVLGSMSHDYTPVSPPMQCPSPCPSPVPHPKCPCSTLRLARAAQLLTRQKGISMGGWGRKRHRLDARLCLGGQALSTRRGHMPATSTAPTHGRPALALASVSLPFSLLEGSCLLLIPACLGPPPARTQHCQLLPPATKLLSKQGAGSLGGAKKPRRASPMPCSGEMPEWKGGACLPRGKGQGSRAGWAL